MSVTETLRAVSKLLIGVAWADGQVTADEMALIKDMIFRLPEITAQDWADLDIYWLTPLGSVELYRLQAAFLKTLTTPESKIAVKHMLTSLVNADGLVTPQEAHLLREAEKALDRQQNVVDSVKELLAAALPKRANDLKGDAGKFGQKRVTSRLKQVYGDNIAYQMGLHDDELRKLALAGSLMGRVAYADFNISQTEINLMQTIVERGWSLRADHAQIIVEYAMDAARYKLDFDRLAREFFEATSYQERLEFIDVLFEIAFAQDGIFAEELTEIDSISAALKIKSRDYADLRQYALKRGQRH